jgi:outer membrane protein assembly factor BamB
MINGISVCISCLAVSQLLSAGDPGQWPTWRGPEGSGVARTDAPLHWSDTENIKWKANIPGRGHSSPLVWGDKIFLTTAVPTDPANATRPGRSTEKRALGHAGNPGQQPEQRFEVICLGKMTGKVLWERTAITTAPHEGYHHMYGSFASNSPVTDGKYLYAFFGSRGVYCYDLDGKLIWQKDLGRMKMRLDYGEGAAPALGGETLVLPFDQESGSFIVALDKNTGNELWREERDEQSNWTMPLILAFKGGKQVVAAGAKKVQSYDLATGKLVWECAGLGPNVIPAPVYHEDLVYVMSGYLNPNLMAIRLGRTGDLTGSDAVVWSTSRGTSYSASPVLFDDKLYTITDRGMLSCYNARTGEPYYQMTRLPKPYSFKSSPVAANGKLYLTAEDEDVIVVKMGKKFEVLATNTLAGQFFVSTPAIADGEIFLRGQNTLFCISRKH